jgi:hypothetical protein
VIFKKGGGASVDSATTEYHLTEPVKMTMCERRQVAGVVTGIVEDCRKAWPLADVYYIGTFPRFVTKCCNRKEHMSAEDPQVINMVRRELDKEIVSQLVDLKEEVRFIDWFELLGFNSEPTLKEIVDKKCMDDDRVHLSSESNSAAAFFLCRRMLEGESEDEMDRKRQRIG